MKLHHYLPLFARGLALLPAVGLAAENPKGGMVFHRSGFAQLSRGEFGNAGQNLFVSARRTLTAYSSSANLLADFDGDGFNDIVAINHTGPHSYVGTQLKSAHHGVGSFIYWGARSGFDENRRTWIASYGPHATINAEVGDILRRRPFETYTAPWTDAKLAAGEYQLAISGTFVGRASCSASVQTDGATTWSEATATISPSDDGEKCFTLKIPAPATRFRYRLELRTGGAGTGPTITAIELRQP